MSSPLNGICIKIDRANKHLADLTTAISRFEAGKPFDVVTDMESHPPYEVYRFAQRDPIPVEWSALIGDCVHNARSALDHLAVALVVHGGGSPTQYTAFPVGRDEPDFVSRLQSRLNGASQSAIEIIRKLKPYGGADSAIYNLHCIDIIDKHESLIPVAAAHSMWGFQWDIRQPKIPYFPPQMLQGAAPERKFPLKDGDILGSYHRKTGEGIEDKTRFDFGFEIAFGEGQIFDGDPVVPTLKQHVEFIEDVSAAFASEVFGVLSYSHRQVR
jgi:hypothetical protein